MFDFMKKKSKDMMIVSPMKGRAVPISQVSDPTFGQEILGKGAAIQPSEGKVYAPADGEITLLFDTLHAVSLTTELGAEILVHIGLDTVKLQGEHYQAHVATGDKVKKGDLLITVDLEAVKAAGYEIITPVVICNTADFALVEAITGSEVNPGDDLIRIKQK